MSQNLAKRDYRTPKVAKLSLLYVRTAMTEEPSRIWTIEELCLATRRPMTAVARALAALVDEGTICRARADRFRVDVDARKKVWMLRVQSESDALVDAELERQIEMVRNKNAKLKTMVDWLTMMRR